MIEMNGVRHLVFSVSLARAAVCAARFGYGDVPRPEHPRPRFYATADGTTFRVRVGTAGRTFGEASGADKGVE